MNAPQKVPLCLPLFGGLLAVFGVGFLLYAVMDRGRARASVDWPSVPGRILVSEVEEAGHDIPRTYAPNVRYRYEVEGQTYEGDTLAFADNINRDEDYVLARIAPYPVGSQADVHYDPAHPETSVLEPGVRQGSGILLIVGPFFALVGVLLGFVAPRLLAAQRR
ncbi:MAG: DUF3592 domain-containing protein [Planctomycetota bacterium]